MNKQLERACKKWLLSNLKTNKTQKVPLVAAYSGMFKNKIDKATARINYKCGTNYSRKRFVEWGTGTTALPRKVQTHMQEEVLKFRLGEEISAPLLQFLNLQARNSDLL